MDSGLIAYSEAIYIDISEVLSSEQGICCPPLFKTLNPPAADVPSCLNANAT